MHIMPQRIQLEGETEIVIDSNRFGRRLYVFALVPVRQQQQRSRCCQPFGNTLDILEATATITRSVAVGVAGRNRNTAVPMTLLVKSAVSNKVVAVWVAVSLLVEFVL